jgi:signal transduction histidine kinase
MNDIRPLLAASWRSWLSYDLRAPDDHRALRWIWTALLALAIAALFTVLGALFAGSRVPLDDPARWARWFGKNLIISGVVTALAHVLFDALAPWARPRVARWRMGQRTLFFVGVPMGAMVLGWPLGLMLAGIDVPGWFGSSMGLRIATASLLISLVVTAVLHGVFSLKAQQLHAEQRATEAQLRLLQAQMEPHFLFNTLANVLALMEHDVAAARQTLQAFTDYLRATLVGMRRALAPLASELALADAYLRVVQVRMGPRLAWHIEADAAAREVPLPPLLLQPLVENAIEHGLASQLAGGTLAIRARCEGPMLVVEVEDNGAGLPARSNGETAGDNGRGVALANIRARLSATYGATATLHLQPRAPGTMARLSLPLNGAVTTECP